MAADRVPADENLERTGRQMNAREAREAAAREGTLPGVPRPTTTDREVHGPVMDGLADERGARGASGSTGNDAVTERAPDQRDYTDAETALGGADTVQKTTWGVGTGAEPDGRREYAPVGLRKGEGEVVARTDAGGGANPVAWIVGLLAAAAALIYGFGVLGG
jgi:hypothetical protein